MSLFARHCRLPASLAAALLLVVGCELFADLKPCTPGRHEECATAEICGGDGFCRPTTVPPDDAGARHDAGPSLVDSGPDDDGGPPMDAGNHEAGQEPDAGPPLLDSGPEDDDDAGAPPDAGLVDAGDPEAPCGNGVLNVGETCDDGATWPGDGCDDACQSEAGWLCVGAPSDCVEDCGDGVIIGGEECDDGAANSDTLPDACRTDCTAARCGDGVIDDDATRSETCDGADLGALSCLERGYLAGTGPVSCDLACAALDLTTCGAAIDGVEALRAALLEAYASEGSVVISVHPGVYEVGASVDVDDTEGEVAGVTLRPLDGGSVRFTPASGFTDALLRLSSGNNRVERLAFINATRAIDVAASDNVVERSLFLNNAGFPPDDLVYVGAARNRVQHNRFLNASGSGSGRALHAVVEDGLHVTRNLVQGASGGNFSEGIRVTGVSPANNRVTFVLHNSVDVTGSVIGLHLEDTGQLCSSNNVIRGNNPTLGLRLSGTVVLGNAARCGVLSQKNAVVGMVDNCTGDPCTTLCDGAGALCDLTAAPGFGGDGCLATTSALIDAGHDASAPPVDGDGTALPYSGAAPDVGAREAGTSATHGDSVTTCLAP